jgi:methionine-rich copper-binding protein CopC
MRRQQDRKRFFFEKKKQKTFDLKGLVRVLREAPLGKVFWFFSSEKNAFLALFSVFFACGATPAMAHAFLESASPRVGSAVPAAPAEVVLTFTQGIEPAFSRIEVLDASGTSVQAGAAHTEGGDPTKFGVALGKVGAGVFTVIWHVTSVDTHKTQGKFHFTVGP